MAICIPIKEKNIKVAMEAVKKASEKADVVEIWLDNFDVNDYKKLIRVAKKPVLIVNKDTSEKGEFVGTEEERVNCLIAGLSYSPKYVDIGINTDIELIQKIVKAKKKTKLIISYHNFEMTPSWDELVRISELIVSLGADIVKIATRVKKTQDTINLVRVIGLIDEMGKKSIVTGMGKKGRLIRVIAPLLGSIWTYAPISVKKATAPGQFTRKQLEQIWKLIDD